MSSEVWKYFKIHPRDDKFAICNFCEKLVSRGGKSKTTSNLLKHLEIHKKKGQKIETKITKNITRACLTSSEGLLKTVEPVTSTPVIASTSAPVIASSSALGLPSSRPRSSGTISTFFKPILEPRPTETNLDPDDPSWLSVDVSDDTTDSAASSSIIPLIHTVFSVVKNQNVTSSGLLGLKNDIISSMKRRYPSVENNLSLACSTLLDPRFKDMPFQNKDSLERAKVKILMEMEEHININPPVAENETDNTRPSDNSSKKHGFWAHYAEVFKQPSSSNSEQQEVMGCQEELTQYLTERTLDPKEAEKLGSYWFSSPHSRLKKLALKYLCVPPSTVFSERLFSTAGIICDQKRNRLDPERIKMLVFLNKNIK